ncbi:hypothetical protein HanRHA438_Chr10g0455331 [Helianthus annuus]|nr:hypothetical protein HanIR_Chr10g0477681 [Helianthus annuus]KAJ0879768.1 hypothetical protein HanRHA438_Chr10g0455331 [Helianthus annuus]
MYFLRYQLRSHVFSFRLSCRFEMNLWLSNRFRSNHRLRNGFRFNLRLMILVCTGNRDPMSLRHIRRCTVYGRRSNWI